MFEVVLEGTKEEIEAEKERLKKSGFIISFHSSIHEYGHNIKYYEQYLCCRTIKERPEKQLTLQEYRNYKYISREYFSRWQPVGKTEIKYQRLEAKLKNSVNDILKYFKLHDKLKYKETYPLTYQPYNNSYEKGKNKNYFERNSFYSFKKFVYPYEKKYIGRECAKISLIPIEEIKLVVKEVFNNLGILEYKFSRMDNKDYEDLYYLLEDLIKEELMKTGIPFRWTENEYKKFGIIKSEKNDKDSSINKMANLMCRKFNNTALKFLDQVYTSPRKVGKENLSREEYILFRKKIKGIIIYENELINESEAGKWKLLYEKVHSAAVKLMQDFESSITMEEYRKYLALCESVIYEDRAVSFEEKDEYEILDKKISEELNKYLDSLYFVQDFESDVTKFEYRNYKKLYFKNKTHIKNPEKHKISEAELKEYKRLCAKIKKGRNEFTIKFKSVKKPKEKIFIREYEKIYEKIEKAVDEFLWNLVSRDKMTKDEYKRFNYLELKNQRNSDEEKEFQRLNEKLEFNMNDFLENLKDNPDKNGITKAEYKKYNELNRLKKVKLLKGQQLSEEEKNELSILYKKLLNSVETFLNDLQYEEQEKWTAYDYARFKKLKKQSEILNEINAELSEIDKKEFKMLSDKLIRIENKFAREYKIKEKWNSENHERFEYLSSRYKKSLDNYLNEEKNLTSEEDKELINLSRCLKNNAEIYLNNLCADERTKLKFTSRDYEKMILEMQDSLEKFFTGLKFNDDINFDLDDAVNLYETVSESFGRFIEKER